MIFESNDIIIGFDLNREDSQITFYNRTNADPMTVSIVPGEEKYLIPTPKDIFSLIEGKAELGVVALSNFFRQCFDMLSTAGPPDRMSVMVTMQKMDRPWVEAIPQALEMLGVKRESVFLQDHKESFYYYVLSQPKELWTYKVALFEYEEERITGCELAINKKTKPATVTVTERALLPLDKKVRQGLKGDAWNQKRDGLFLEMAQEMFGKDAYSSVYLIGKEFGEKWAVETLRFLCRRRHVFQGMNLYTKGACYGAMDKAKAAPLEGFLYQGEDMIEYNLGMDMTVKGVKGYYPLITAGVNWYEAYHECEFLMDDTDVFEFYSKSILGGEQYQHSIELKGLPARPKKATRLLLRVGFTGKNKCRIRIDDLGLGSFWPSSGKKWETVIKL